jgi:molybdate transport system regulatory protein
VPAHPGVGDVAPGYRIWLQREGVRMFGPGTRELLHQVAVSGSLHQAAKLMGMSYSKAWNLLRETEEHLGLALVDRHVGGASGGGTSLTSLGYDFLRRFDQFVAETDTGMRKAFDTAFDGWQTESSTELQP